MNNIQVFKNDQFGQVRAACGENGEPTFVAKDICAILDLGNPPVRPSLFSTMTRRESTVWTPLAASSR